MSDSEVKDITAALSSSSSGDDDDVTATAIAVEGEREKLSPIAEGEDISEEITQSGKKGQNSDPISVPPPVPPSGISTLSHKLWIGNLDKRLTE